MKQYQARFGIDGGVSHGLGSKYPDYSEKTQAISALSDREAMEATVRYGRFLANEHLSNPDTGYTTVTISSLRNNEGEELPQETLGGDLNLIFNNDKKVVLRCSTLEHLIRTI